MSVDRRLLETGDLRLLEDSGVRLLETSTTQVFIPSTYRGKAIAQERNSRRMNRIPISREGWPNWGP